MHRYLDIKVGTLFWIFIFVFITTLFIYNGQQNLTYRRKSNRQKLFQNLKREFISLDNAADKQLILSRVVLRTSQELRYAVNVHFWDYTCGHTVESLRSHPLFPYFPFRRRESSKLKFNGDGVRFGARIFGYLHPNTTGSYKFALSSDDASELWLSRSPDPTKSSLIAFIGGHFGKEWAFLNQFDKYKTQESKTIGLLAGNKYFFEVLWKQNIGRGHVNVVWKIPGSLQYKSIDKSYLSKYYDDSHLDDGLVYKNHVNINFTESYLPQHIPQEIKTEEVRKLKRKTPYERRSIEFLSLPVMRYQEISDIFPACHYKPSYMVSKKKAKTLKLYEAIHLTHYYNLSTRLWPDDNTFSHCVECIGNHLKPMHCKGTPLLDQNTAEWVSNSFLRALKKKFKSRFTLHTLVNVEQTNDDKYGHRYFLEVVLWDSLKKEMVRVSVYFYHPKKMKTLCYPKKFQWDPTAMVYLTLTVKDQGPWVCEYIRSLAKIYRLTKDERFFLIIVDFDSFDVNVEYILKQSGLPRYKIIKMKGRFHKTSAIQAAASFIKDPNAIILQTDLHLEFPLNFINDVRKRCVQGKMGYTPVVLRLACGRLPYNSAGFWEFFGYGIFGFYKSDWDRIKGMDVKQFRNAWGGEDWEFADRVIKNGYEIDRLRLPYFFHYFHSKKGMWDGKAQ